MESKTKIGVVYGRISRDARDDKTSTTDTQSSLDKQEDGCFHYAQEKSIPIVSSFSDPDVSGWTPLGKRKGGGELLKFIDSLAKDKSKQVHLIVYAIDRLGRKASNILTYVEWLEEHGVILHVIDMGGDTMNTQGHNGWLLLAMRVVLAQWEYKNTCARYQATVEHRFDRNERVCKTVYGFDLNRTGEFRKISTGATKEIIKLIPNDTEQEWIRFMRDMRNVPDATNIKEHGLKTGYWKIAAALNEQRVPNKSGDIGRWSGGMVHRILHSRHTNEKVEA